MTRMGQLVETPLSRFVRAPITIATGGRGMTDLTRDLAGFLAEARAADGLLSLYLRHTSASLTIQENADPDVRSDLLDALDRLAPEGSHWRHDAEGPDDMPAHVKAMLTGAALTIPVLGGRMALGTWQGVYLVEHRARPHTRTVLAAYVGA